MGGLNWCSSAMSGLGFAAKEDKKVALMAF